MSNTWVLVADSSCAKIFDVDYEEDTLNEVSDFIHPGSRIREQDVTTDLPGRNSGGGKSRHNYEGKTDIREIEAEKFAKEIDVQLEVGRHNGKYKKLVVAADPDFLGILRDNLSTNVSKLISYELNKDLVKFSPQEIRKHLPRRL